MLGDDRLARERRLVNLKVGRLYQSAVGRYLVAHLYYYYVANDNVFPGNLHHLAAAAHLHGRLLAQGCEHVELLGGVHLEPEADGGGQHDGQDYADGLDEVAVDGGQAERDDSGHK